jgi:two-component system, NtrC family, C4-dicarboxylate transport response regulator DctD
MEPTSSATERSTPEVILVVDDESDIRELLRELLELSGYLVITAESAEEAYSMLRRQRVGAVISDILMEGESGVDLLIRIRQVNCSMPFILLSGFAGEHTETTVMAAGADALIAKPFEQKRLLAALRRAINKRSQIEI